MAPQKDLTPLFARRVRRAELLGQLPVARQAVADAAAELAAATWVTAQEQRDRLQMRLAERQAQLAAVYQGLAPLVRSAPYRAACEDAASALAYAAAETVALLDSALIAQAVTAGERLAGDAL